MFLVLCIFIQHYYSEYIEISYLNSCLISLKKNVHFQFLYQLLFLAKYAE